MIAPSAAYAEKPLVRELHLSDPEATCDLARRLAKLAQVGDILALKGTLGAGKTCFARAFIQACLAAPEEVPSPGYALVFPYEGKNFPLWHVDFYRIEKEAEIVELGLEEAEAGVLLVEWPEKWPDLPPHHLELGFTIMGEQSRMLRLEAHGGGWAERLKAFD